MERDHRALVVPCPCRRSTGPREACEDGGEQDRIRSSANRCLFVVTDWPTIGAAALIALTLSLGRWQTLRAEEKQARQALLETRTRETPLYLTGAVDSAEPLLFRRVRAAGHWIPRGQIFVDNQIRGGRAGFHVITPAVEATKGSVLLTAVVARSGDYPPRSLIAVPAVVEVTGRRTLPPSVLSSGRHHGGDVWQTFSTRYAAHTGTAVLPVLVLADAPAPGLAAVRENPDAGIARHREYALTWFSLAALALGLWIVLNLRKER